MSFASALRMLAGDARTASLTPRHLAILASVIAHPGCTNKVVSRDVGVPEPFATGAVNRLIMAGLVHRVQDPTDLRRVSLTATDGGREVLARLCAAAVEQEV